MSEIARHAVEKIVGEMLDDIESLFSWSMDDLSACENCGCWLTVDEKAPISDVNLCPHGAFDSARFPNEPCYRDRPWRKAIQMEFGKPTNRQDVLDSILARIEREQDNPAFQEAAARAIGAK